MAIKQMELAAPVSPGERKRFFQELKTREPFIFKDFHQHGLKPEEFCSPTFGGHTRIKDVLEALGRLGWTQGAKKNDKIWVLKRNGFWPLEVYASSYGAGAYIVVHLLGDGADEDFSVALQKLSKALFGNPSMTRWSSSRRRDQATYFKIVDKILALGFKTEKREDTSIPDGSWVGGETLYRRADGWNIITRRSVGSIPGEYSFSVRIEYDARRGM